MMLGFVGGGVIAEAYNWRIAMVSVGLPGLLLAVFMASPSGYPPSSSEHTTSVNLRPVL